MSTVARKKIFDAVNITATENPLSADMFAYPNLKSVHERKHDTKDAAQAVHHVCGGMPCPARRQNQGV
jgi:hypothetical protein